MWRLFTAEFSYGRYAYLAALLFHVLFMVKVAADSQDGVNRLMADKVVVIIFATTNILWVGISVMRKGMKVSGLVRLHSMLPVSPQLHGILRVAMMYIVVVALMGYWVSYVFLGQGMTIQLFWKVLAYHGVILGCLAVFYLIHDLTFGGRKPLRALQPRGVFDPSLYCPVWRIRLLRNGARPLRNNRIVLQHPRDRLCLSLGFIVYRAQVLFELNR